MRNTSISIVSSDMRARCGRISRPLFENTLSTNPDEAFICYGQAKAKSKAQDLHHCWTRQFR